MPPQTLTPRALNRATLARQGLLEPLATDGVAVQVTRIGSLQAQHPDWPPVALQARLAIDAPPVDLVAARHAREVVRATLMRMTVHVVAAADFWPMSTITLGFRANQFRVMYKMDPVTSPLARRLTAGQRDVLAAMREAPLAIAEIERILAGAAGDVEIPPNRAAWRHFSGSVPLVLVPFDGEAYGRARYQPAADWLGPPPEDAADRDRAVAHVAAGYLAAFGPASVADLAAYLGLGKSVTSLRAGLATLDDRLVPFRDTSGRELIDIADGPRPDPDTPAPPRLLSRWDSLLLAHATRHRDRVLPPAHQATVITRNADVLPTMLVDGMVAGTWLPRRAADGTRGIELRPFGRLAAADRAALEAEAQRLLPVLADGAFARYPGSD